MVMTDLVGEGKERMVRWQGSEHLMLVLCAWCMNVEEDAATRLPSWSTKICQVLGQHQTNSGAISSDLVPVLCPLSRALLPGQPSRTIFACAPVAIHKLWAMS